jgi:hypothetical protein
LIKNIPREVDGDCRASTRYRLCFNTSKLPSRINYKLKKLDGLIPRRLIEKNDFASYLLTQSSKQPEQLGDHAAQKFRSAA